MFCPLLSLPAVLFSGPRGIFQGLPLPWWGRLHGSGGGTMPAVQVTGLLFFLRPFHWITVVTWVSFLPFFKHSLIKGPFKAGPSCCHLCPSHENLNMGWRPGRFQTVHSYLRPSRTSQYQIDIVVYFIKALRQFWGVEKCGYLPCTCGVCTVLTGCHLVGWSLPRILRVLHRKKEPGTGRPL